MTRLRVDPASLRDARGRLGRLAYELETLHVGIWQVWDRVGGHALAGELEHFCGTWHGANTRLASQVAELGRQLEVAAAAYERIEHRVAEPGASHHRSGGSGSGTTVIGGSSGSGSPGRSSGASGSGSGSGTTVIGGSSGSGSPGRSSGAPGSGSGSGTTVIG